MKNKMVKVGDQMCAVETLREWLNSRITTMRQSLRFHERCGAHVICCLERANTMGRLAELIIIREKINDGRIPEIG